MDQIQASHVVQFTICGQQRGLRLSGLGLVTVFLIQSDLACPIVDRFTVPVLRAGPPELSSRTNPVDRHATPNTELVFATPNCLRGFCPRSLRDCLRQKYIFRLPSAAGFFPPRGGSAFSRVASAPSIISTIHLFVSSRLAAVAELALGAQEADGKPRRSGLRRVRSVSPRELSLWAVRETRT